MITSYELWKYFLRKEKYQTPMPVFDSNSELCFITYLLHFQPFLKTAYHFKGDILLKRIKGLQNPTMHQFCIE